ncbi:MAG: hypothetical protein ACD_2C00189G0012 [uncultured bacterium (gcode 4)]|uniref:Uncharacterized protein n=1 Tax=uncultured bacterium (gcode 4) TaxID=1234023 RepID=K2G287_9BACT|nr:MAG: hypothetical protein ACD_2C00189G0012 [uncultured bacterium (gcode 4)]
MKPASIVLIHKWYQWYLEYSILQAKKFNPESDIYLIGDDANSFLWKKLGINHIDIDSCLKSGKDFEKAYVHLSGNSYHYELFCFQRWFILKEIAERFNLEKIVYIDSDILLYANVNEEFKRLSDLSSFQIAYVWTSWHTCYFTSQESINAFCNFIIVNYSSEDKIEYMRKFYKEYSKTNATWWVSDMFIFWLYKKYWEGILDIAEISNQSTYDLNFNCNCNSFDFWLIYPDLFPDYLHPPIIFEPFLNTKKTIFKNWLMYWKSAWNDQLIRLNTLHLQWFSKSYMKYFYNEQFILLKINIFMHYLIELIYNNFKVVRYLRKAYKSFYEKIIFKNK